MSERPAAPADGLGPWKEFLCRACGLIYNEGDGDPDSGLAPGTRFADIPEDWCCPVCGVRKQDFEPYEASGAAFAAPVRVQGLGRDVGVVILGGGMAGWTVAREIRARDAEMPITLVSRCSADVYHKPELAVAFSRGLAPDTLRREVGSQAAERLGIRLVSEALAVGLSPRFGKLRTTRGTLAYTSLVVATGATARLPKGIDPSLAWRVDDLQAWTGLHAALAGRRRKVVILGAGMVGCELADDLARADHDVTLLALGETPIERMLPPQAGHRVRAGLESVGVDYRVDGVAALERDGRGSVAIRLTGGAVLVADAFIVAAGVETKGRIFRNAGLAFDNGLIVDPRTLRTSDPSIFALGDCISLDGAHSRFIEPIARQSATIAASVTGGPAVAYEHRPPVIRLKARSAPVTIEGWAEPVLEWHTASETDDLLVLEQRRGSQMVARLTVQ